MNGRAIKEMSAPEQTITIAATFTAEPLVEPINFWLDELCINATVQFAPFNQVFQSLLDPASLLNSNANGLNVILIRADDWCGSPSGPVSGTDTLPLSSLQTSIDEFTSALHAATENASAPFMVCLCHENPQRQANIGLNGQVAGIVRKMISDIQSFPGVLTVTPHDIDSRYPVPDYYDAEQDALASIPYVNLYYVSLATTIMRQLYALSTPDIKVIVLDCDNTLWMGVCGEDGAHGIDVDFASHMLQEFMISQYNNGVLLCLSSKNNEQDVIDVFNLRPDMPLDLKHFISTRINWKPKSGNLISMAEELGLSLDSFVFIDDDPVECDEVRSRCPAVTTLQLPRQRPLIPEFLKHAWVFDHTGITMEASDRNTLYRHDTMRKSAAADSTSLEDFIERLELSIDISEMKEENIPRVTELFNRTNQFNASTVRYSVNEVRSLFSSKKKTILVTRAKDRFGDYGLIGVAVYCVHQEQMTVDSLLLSCRALGRNIEHTLLTRLAEIANTAGCSTLGIQYVETTRNQLVRDFLEGLGSSHVENIPAGLEFRFPTHYLLGQ